MSQASEISVIGMGAMGSAVAKRLLERGARVITNLDGRSEKSRRRAAELGIEERPMADVAAAGIILSIVPPDQAITVARAVRSAGDPNTASVFADLNAVAPQTMAEIAMVFRGGPHIVVDGCIIGGPPKADGSSPHIYASGPDAGALSLIGDLGLFFTAMGGAIGDASALKMLYAGISKGVTGLAALMLLTAAERGFSDVLTAEMQSSMPALFKRFQTAIPDMFPKAQRWKPEMLEIASFLGENKPGAEIFKGIADAFALFSEADPAFEERRRKLAELLSAE